ncbi:IPT/TIG domain-containing protein [Paenibacillus sp.]|uniref:IPT/TIG domain-containing protein n=1 Tax=Paenibacillus sp. TaxID=58172 RepID=UPI00282A45DD|nr:IPT/TIG domain-containing protein [Paenibacillus sp.]MDR0268707.1 IPT/TIG domain-containing protein [Paenibacillus sp.]
MNKKPKLPILILALVLFVGQLFGSLAPSVALAANEAVQVTKTINPSETFEGGEAEVTVNVQGSPDVNVVKPNDVILIIDKSTSMSPTYQQNNGEDKMKNAKEAAKGFIDLVDFSKHRVGVVDFSSSASFKDLSTNASDLKNYINTITANGGTNTHTAIDQAQTLLRSHRADAQPVIILMTDGDATDKPAALKQAAAAKAEGIVFYTIALLQPNENPDTSAANLLMKDMATTKNHHHFVLGSVGLSEIYKAIVDEIGIASAYNVSISDVVSPEFEIVPDSYKDNIPQPTVVGNKLTWNFLELKKEALTFKYKIRHKSGAATGDLPVGNQDVSVKYNDYLGNQHQNTVVQPTIKVNSYAPVITSVVKDNGLIQGGEQVVINGQNFKPDPKVTFEGVAAQSVQYVSPEQLIVKTPAGAQGTVTVTVTNVDGQSATANYKYIANPTITSITPSFGPVAGGTKVVINGDYYLPGAVVKFGDQVGTIVSTTAKQIIVNTPPSTTAQTVDVTITNPDDTTVTEKQAYSYLVGPEVTSVTPNSGLILGNESIKINGSHFIDGAKVYFNNTLISSTFVSDTELSATTPSWAKAESVKVKVINPDGQEAALDSGYKYVNPKPVINSISPSQGLVSGDLVVDIKGQYFLNGAKVFFDGVQLQSVTFYDSTQLKVRTPIWGKADVVDVQVVNPDGQDDVKADGFTYVLPDAPKISDIKPVEGPLSGGTSVSITGSNLGSVTELYLGSAKVDIKSNNGTTITFTTPKATTAGKVDVRVVDKYGRASDLPKAFEYLAPPPPPVPTFISITPNQGEMKGGYTAVVKGTNFEGTSKVFVNGISAATLFYSSSELRITVPASSISGAVDVMVLNASGEKTTEGAGAFTYLAPPPKPVPAITSVTPNEGELKGGYIIKVLGSNFDSTMKVYFNGSLVQSTFYSSGEIRLTVPASQTPGEVDIKFVNSDGKESNAVAFTYLAPPPPPAPTITSVTPSEGYLAGGYSIVVKGTNFNKSTIIQMDNQPIPTIFYSNTELRGSVPASSVAKVIDVAVMNPGEQPVISKGAFSYIAPPPPPAPTITSLSPDSGVKTGGYYSYVNGTNFNSSTKVYFNDVLVNSVYYSPTQIRALVPASATPGTVTVRVVNDTQGVIQGAELPDAFTYLMPPTPSITQINPNSGEMAGGYTIAIIGANFNSSSVVYINNSASQTTFYSTTELRVRVPKATQPGPVDVEVVTGDQRVSSPEGFTYNTPPKPPAPVITSITPNTGQMAGGYYTSIKGANFDANSKVLINNIEVQTVFYSATEVRGRVPASSVPGPVDVVVVNKDMQRAESLGGFIYDAPPQKPAPTITSVTPNTGALAGGGIISIKGTNFESTTKVYINNISVQTIFYFSGEVRAYVPASKVAGSVDIRVENSDSKSDVLTGGYTYQ